MIFKIGVGLLEVAQRLHGAPLTLVEVAEALVRLSYHQRIAGGEGELQCLLVGRFGFLGGAGVYPSLTYIIP